LYAIVWEEPKDIFVGLYLPIDRLVDDVKRETGMDITLDVDHVDGMWRYKEYGKGMCMPDIK